MNYGKTNNKWYAQVGIATGNIINQPTNTIWPEWEGSTNVIHEINWITKLQIVPDEICSKRAMTMKTEQVENVIDYIMSQN